MLVLYSMQIDRCFSSKGLKIILNTLNCIKSQNSEKTINWIASQTAEFTGMSRASVSVERTMFLQ
jgi:hypothetical protein